MGATTEQDKDAFVDEGPIHEVTLADFYVGETEVTQALWYAVLGITIDEQKNKKKADEKPKKKKAIRNVHKKKSNKKHK